MRPPGNHLVSMRLSFSDSICSAHLHSTWRCWRHVCKMKSTQKHLINAEFSTCIDCDPTTCSKAESYDINSGISSSIYWLSAFFHYTTLGWTSGMCQSTRLWGSGKNKLGKVSVLWNLHKEDSSVKRIRKRIWLSEKVTWPREHT